VLSLAPCAEAEIVYTPANVVIGRDGSYALDLNNDGVVDFRIAEFGGKIGASNNRQSLDITALGVNKVACQSSPGCLDFHSVAALAAGVQIGYNPFWERGYLFEMAVEKTSNGIVQYYGFWVKVKDRYLALQFEVNGKVHYGWARLTVKFRGVPPQKGTWQATLTGYAYETIPDAPIIAGKTSGNYDEESDASKPWFSGEKIRLATLGTLALGRR
jgi:hypothetical protein